MYSSGVCISPPCAQPRQSAGMPAASAALASVEAATSSSGSAELLAHAAHGREQRLTAVEAAGRAAAQHLDLERERRLDRERAQRPREAREHGLVERALLDHELGVGRDRVDGRAALDAADVRAGLAPGRAAERARDAADLVDRARAPAVGPGVAARPVHGDARAQAADRVDGDVQQAMALERQRQLGLQLRAGRARPARLPRPSSPTVNATASPCEAALARQLLDDLDGADDRRGVVADPGAAQRARPRAGARAARSRANTVSTCTSRSTRGRPSPKRQIRLPAASTLRRPGARARRRCEPGDALALVERRRGHAREREQVVEGIVHGAHAARTLSGRDARRADRRCRARGRQRRPRSPHPR